MDEQTRVIVLFGGQSAEHDVSCVSARHVLAAIDRDRYSIEPIGISRDGAWLRSDDAISMLENPTGKLPEMLTAAGQEVDALPVLAPKHNDQQTVVLPILHGPMGEDGTVQGLFELAGVPYVGTGLLGSALCMDKVAAKEMTEQNGIPQCRFRTLLVDSGQPDSERLGEIAVDLGYPMFVKPANMGSSVGVSKADTADELAAAVVHAAQFDEWLVIEEGVRAREIELGVLGNQGTLRASVPGEIVPGDDFYSYDDKYHDGVADTIVPAALTPEQSTEVQELAVRAAQALRVEGLARVDFFFEEHGRGFLLNEINTMPGFTPISMFPKLWEASGMPYAALIDELVRLALDRHSRRSAHRTTSR